MSNLRVYPIRLLPGMELKSCLIEFVKTNNLKACFILTCCGSLQKVTIRFASDTDKVNKVRSLNTCFEITSLVGTICSDGAHLHITLGDPEGNTVSGHLVGDAVVETTAEVVLGEVLDACFTREHDPSTGFRELCISRTMQD